MQRIALSLPVSNGHPSGLKEEEPLLAIACLAFARKETFQIARGANCEIQMTLMRCYLSQLNLDC